MTDSNQTKNNQFGLGLLIGFLAGFTSYFLLNTDKGKELQQQFKDKWQAVENDWPSLSELKIGDLAVKDLIAVLLGRDSAIVQTEEPKLKIKDARRSSSRNKNGKRTKFKGV
jgi:hypothetical protein